MVPRVAVVVDDDDGVKLRSRVDAARRACPMPPSRIAETAQKMEDRRTELEGKAGGNDEGPSIIRH